MSDLYTPLSVDEIRDIMLRAINAELPDQRTGIGSQTRTEIDGIARAIADNHLYLDAISRNVTPVDADEFGLELWAVALDVPRKAGEPSRRAQALRVRGDVGATVPLAATLQHFNNVQYEITLAAVVPPIGYVDVDIQALSPGAITRLSTGEQLKFDVTPLNVEPVATLVRDVNEGGTDQETLGAWRNRILGVWRDKRAGGSRNDYRAWSLELSWVSRVYVYPRKPTIESVGIVALKSGSGSAILPTGSEIAELSERLELDRPVTDNVIILAVDLTLADIEITLVLTPGNAADWTRPLGGLTLASYDADNALVTTNEPLPADLVAGDLLTVRSASPATTGANGRPARVSAIVGPNSFIIVPTDDSFAALNFTPDITDELWPSSEVMLSVRDSVLAGITSCDDFRVEGLLSVGPANPMRRHGSWDADFRADTVTAIANANSSVGSSTALIVPSTNGVLESVEYPFPNDTTVQLLQPRQVWVHL